MAADPDAELRVAEALLDTQDVAAGKEAAPAAQGSLEHLSQPGKLAAQPQPSRPELTPAAPSSAAALEDTAAAGAGFAPVVGDFVSPVFPVADWHRYLPERFLGQGGMGKVFLARDRQLGRRVAIKFVRGDDPTLAHRFLLEARAQARVQHERVCKVYEVGEVDGKVYIAMQYIDGRPLGAVAATLTFEQRAMVIREAALGLHEAHRAGIIHRDIKPGNIMIERSEDGGLRPYVMDFGLARDWNESATETGTVLGTPHYMSPEQARGEVGGLDRRADVYSLGATLYHLLTDRPPIPGANPLEILSHIATFEPVPPRQYNPDVPEDLAAIALQCLEKDRSARYESARALAEDLDRFLAGEPVTARRAARPFYRLRKRLRKHWRLAAAGTLALLVCLLSLGWGAVGRREAAVRTQLARRFTAAVKNIEAMARYSALSPLHDTRADRQAIKARMDELAAEVKKVGAAAVGPGQYALGRGFLALEDDELARQHLEAAWQHGFREPDAAYALALALGHLYKKQLHLLELERFAHPELTRQRKEDIERRYRDRALAYLRQSSSADVPSTAYVEALIAYYEGRFADALHHLDAVGNDLPWFYEAPELRGDIFLAQARQSKWAGAGAGAGDKTRAQDFLQAGRAAYTVAATIGESVAAVHEALGELEYVEVVTKLYGGGDVVPAFTRGVAATERALKALPARYSALLLDARFRRSLAKYSSHQGGPVDEPLAQAIESAQRAVAAVPARPEARLELMRSYAQWGEAREARSEDPRVLLGQAVAIADAIPAADRSYEFYVETGLIYKIWADYEDQTGGSSYLNRGRAIAAYTQALQRNDQGPEVLMDLGINYYERAAQPRSPDPDGDLRQAAAALDKAKAIAPSHILPYFYKGQIHTLMAQRLRDRGLPTGAALEQALAEFRAGLAINPKLPHLHNGIGSVLVEQAKQAWESGQSPDLLLEQAARAYQVAIDVAPEQGNGYSNAASAWLELAQYKLARGQDPSASVQAAVALLNRGLRQAPDFIDFWVNLGWAYSLAAQSADVARRDPQPSLGAAAEALAAALQHNPNSGEAWLYRGATRATTARFHARTGTGKDTDFSAAAKSYKKAIELSPEEAEYRLALGHFCREWAQWRAAAALPPEPALGCALQQVSPLIALRPAWPEVQVLDASLHLLQAQLAGPGEKRRAEAAVAAEKFKAALALNTNLTARWKSQSELAQRLTAPPR